MVVACRAIMMKSAGLEKTAQLIAQNVASAVERVQEGPSLHPLIREALMVEMLRALLPVMPSLSSASLVEACNRCLDHFAGFHGSGPGPRVEAVDVRDGSVTMRRE